MGAQVGQGAQPGPGALEHRDPGVAQVGRLDRVQRRRHGREHDHGLVGGRRGPEYRPRVGLVAVVLLHQVDRQRHRVHVRVGGHGVEAGGEEVLGVGPASPHVQRVGHDEAGVEQRADGGAGGVGQGRERDALGLGDVGDQGPLRAGVVHGGDTGSPLPDPAADGEQLEGVDQLLDVARPVHAVRREEGLPAGVVTGHGAGVGGHQRASGGRAADREGHHRHRPLHREGQPAAQRRRVADGLQEQPDDPGLGPLQRPLDVVAGGQAELLPRGDGQGVVEAAPGAQQRREERPGVGDQGDRPGAQVLPLEVAERADAGRRVHEAHAAAAAQRQVAGRGAHHLGLPRHAAEDHRAAGAHRRGSGELVGDEPVGHAHQDQIGCVVEVVQPRDGTPAGHLAVLGVHEVHPGDAGAPQGLDGQPLAERPGPRRGSHDRHGGGSEEPVDRRTRAHGRS